MKQITRELPGILRRARFAAAYATLAALIVCGTARAELPRRISLSLESKYYVFDSEFFGLGNGFGADAALRYELTSDIYFENGLGVLTTKGDGASVDGLDWHLNFLALFPVLIPYRPVARLGIGCISVNPLTVTPTETFRPTQTTLYLIGGAGVTRSISDNMLIEASASFWVTPYQYRVYRFNRFDVETHAERFTHLSVSIGLAYTF